MAVTIDGKNLPEYEDKDSVENTTKLPFEVTKYIEAVPGRTFEVKCSLANRGFREEHGIEGVKFRLYIDGDYIRSKTTTSFHKDVISGARLFLDGKPYLKKMMFSDEKIGEPAELVQHESQD